MIKFPQKPKTIEELNEFMLYRLFKVFYVILIAIIIFAIFIGLYAETIDNYSRKLDRPNSQVTCDNGKILNLNDFDKYKSLDYFGYEEKKDYNFLCWVEGDMKEKLPERYSADNIYQVNLQYKNKPLVIYIKYILFVTLSLLGLIIGHNILKRTFYYIFFGRFFPEKHKK